jgi:ankyrin repeat protein
MRKIGFWIFAVVLTLAMASAVCFADTTDDLFAAIKAKDIGRVTALLDGGVSANAMAESILGVKNISPLSYAVTWDATEIAVLLIDRGADVNFKDPISEEAVITMAAQRGNTEVVRALVAKGADTNVMDKYLDTTPMTIAAEFGHTETVKLLLNHGVPVDQLTANGSTALHEAAGTAETALVRLLLDRHADVNHANKLGRTPLFSAACSGCSAENARLLLNRGAVVNHKDNNGDTALFFAACSGCKPEIAQLLLARGAHVNLLNNKEKTAFWVAQANANQEVITVLVKAGANGGKMPAATASGLNAADMQFLAEQCKIEQADIDVIPKLDEKTKQFLLGRIALRDCSLFNRFVASRNYFRACKPNAALPMPPAGWDASYLTQEESKSWQKILDDAPW